MASTALLLLLLVSSFLLASTDDPEEQEELNKAKEALKTSGKILLKTIDNIRSAVVPFLALIPVHGPVISAAIDLALMPLSVANKFVNEDKNALDGLRFEFEALNFKIDEYHMQQQWDTWASHAYYKPERDIEVAWMSYITVQRSLRSAKTEDEKQRHREEFRKTYSSYEPATKTLYAFLTAEDTAFISSLGQMVAEHVKCRAKDIRGYHAFITKLIYKGNIMNEFYYQLMNIQSPARDEEQARIAYKCAAAMFQIRTHCLSNSMYYIKKDVEGLIDVMQSRQALAKKVRLFLEEMHDSYNWMVVAFITKSSKHKIIESLNSHILSGFTEVTKGPVTVAVARQVKGTHTYAGEVKKAIEQCIPKHVKCYEVAKKLKECDAKVKGFALSQTYTAVHAFTRKGHASFTAKEASAEAAEEAAEEEVSADPEGTDPYIYTGQCEKSPSIKGGKFIVLIKSTEEIESKDLCSKLDCGQTQSRGECVPVQNIFLAVCECKFPYHGQHCELNIEDHTKRPTVVDSRRPGQRS